MASPQFTTDTFLLQQDSWQRVSAKLRFKHGEATYNSWIKPLKVEEVDAAQVRLSIPTRFMRDWILSHYAEDILSFWREENAAIAAVEVRVKAPEPRLTQSEQPVVMAPSVAAEVQQEAGFANMSAR